MVLLTARREVLTSRLLGRGQMSGRADDHLETILRRFETYETQTAPLVDHDRRQDSLRELDGEGTPDAVAAGLHALLS